MPNYTLKERFWSKVKISTLDECWEWRGSKFPSGYGKIKVANKYKSSHRVSWELTYDFIPEGINVLHHCDNPACVNPNHLFLGTQLDNMRDMCSKNRHGLHLHPEKAARGKTSYIHNHPEIAKGENNSNSKLLERDVLEIRSIYKLGLMTQKELAKTYHVSLILVSLIIRNKRWTHI